MLPPLVLRVDVDLEGGWAIALGVPEMQPARGRLGPEDVAAIRSAVEQAARPGEVVIPGHVTRQERAEVEAGRALAAVFRPAAVQARLVEYRTLAATQGVSPILVVDCGRAELAALPWELIAEAPDGPPLEERTGAVARLARGRPAVLAQGSARLRVLLWCLTPGDAACAAVVEALRDVRISGVEVVELSTALAPELPAPDDHIADLLLLLCHGADDGQGTTLELGADQRMGGPASIVSALAPGLSSIRGVVLGVCEGGTPSDHQLGDLAGRLLLAGANTVVGPAVPVAAEALVTFTVALLEALAQETTSALAVRGARHAVGRLLIPHPDSRPSAFRLHVADLSALGRPWVTRRWRPAGWPTPDVGLSDLLARAHAVASPFGWVGIEHLLEVWPDGARDVAGELRRVLALWDESFARLLRAGHSPRAWPDAPLCTPRLRRLAAALPGERASLMDVASALIDDPVHGLHLLSLRPLAELRWDPLGGQPSLGSLGARELPDIGAPATRFEVLWGPEDGRRIQPEPGQTIGRWHQTALDDHVLFDDTPVLDRGLRRQHLRYLGPGEVELLRRGRILRHGARWQDGSDELGRRRISVGDVVLLTPGTWLRALGPG